MQKRFHLALILVLSVGIIIGLSFNASAQESTSIPKWIKNTAKFWVSGDVSDADFIKALQWLIDQGILTVPSHSQSANTPASSPMSSSNTLSVLLPTNKEIGDFWKIHDPTSTTIFSDISPSMPVYNLKGQIVDANKGQPKYVLEQSFEKSTTPLAKSMLTIDIASFVSPGDLTTFYLSNTRDLYFKIIEDYKRTHTSYKESSFVPTPSNIDTSCSFYISSGTQSGTDEIMCAKHSSVFIIHATGNEVGMQDDMKLFANIILKNIS